MKKLYITHIDQGVEPVTNEDVAGDVFTDPETGRWPKVSFSDGMTLSWTHITNTKVVFFDRANRHVLVNQDYSDLIREFMESDRPFNESNWRQQRRRASVEGPWSAETFRASQLAKGNEVIRPATATLKDFA